MVRAFRRRLRPPVLVVIGCALALLAWGPSLSSGATTPTCSTANLRFEFVRAEGAAGARDWELGLRNTAPQTCRLKGYPRVSLLDRTARVMRVSVGRGHGRVREVVLSAWRRAFFTFHFESSAPCLTAIHPSGLQVVPPGNTGRLRIFRPYSECGGDHPQVTPIRAALNGP